MTDRYIVLELDEDSSFLKLGFYSNYESSFFYYQQKRIPPEKDPQGKGYSEYIFNLEKSACNESENGKRLPVLMTYVSEKGLPLPDEIIQEIRRNNNKVCLYYNGYASFTLSVREPGKGTSTDDDELINKLFGNK